MRKELMIVASVVLFLFVLGLVGENNLGFASRQVINEQKLLPAYDQNKCYDSDNGINLTVKGVTRGPSSFKGSFTSRTDYCLNNYTLVENYCFRNIVTNTTKPCSSLGSNSFCLNSKCCRIISDPGVYVLEDCDLIEGYEGDFFLKKSNQSEWWLLRFDFFSHPDERGYFYYKTGGIVTDPESTGYGDNTIREGFNIQLINFTSDGKPIIRKYASCYETVNLSPVINQFSCPYEIINEEKYLFENKYFGSSPLGYPNLAECAAKRFTKDIKNIYNLTQINPPFKKVEARYSDSNCVGYYAVGSIIITACENFSNPSEISGVDCYNNNIPNESKINGFFVHESTHLVFANGKAISDGYCGLFTEGLAYFIERKTSYDAGEFGYTIGNTNKPLLLNDVLQCGETGWNLNYQPYGNYSNQTTVLANNCGAYHNWNIYEDGKCFWYFIYRDFGESGFKKVLQEFDKKRFQSTPTCPIEGSFSMFKDIIIPALGHDVQILAKEKFGITS